MPRLFLALCLCPLLATQIGAQASPSAILNPGAHVRVKVPRLSSDWILGTVVTLQRAATCLAVRLNHTDAEGRTQYAFFTSVKAMEVDRRTNQGVLVVGLPDPTADDWERWTSDRIALVATRCQR